jgi:TPR repeat protein
LQECLDADSGMDLLRQSAEAGFAPAMTYLGAEEKEGLTWYRKAAELNDPDGLFWLAHCVEDKQFELMREAAAQGHPGGMYHMAVHFSDRLSPVDAATFGARYVLYGGWKDYVVGSVIADAANDLAVLYAAGRELERYDQFWDDCEKPHDLYIRCVEIYLTATHRARRAALHTTLGLRQYIGRDVAKLIGQMVYQTRDDAQAWWHHQRPLSAKKHKPAPFHYHPLQQSSSSSSSQS